MTTDTKELDIKADRVDTISSLEFEVLGTRVPYAVSCARQRVLSVACTDQVNERLHLLLSGARFVEQLIVMLRNALDVIVAVYRTVDVDGLASEEQAVNIEA